MTQSLSPRTSAPSLVVRLTYGSSWTLHSKILFAVEQPYPSHGGAE